MLVKKRRKFKNNMHDLCILEIIFNQILKEGIVPDSFKNGLVVPLYKGNGHKTNIC